jgi:hypothetical protein
MIGRQLLIAALGALAAVQTNAADVGIAEVGYVADSHAPWTRVFTISGEIGWPDVQTVALLAWRETLTPARRAPGRLLMIDSDGGSVGAAKAIGDIVSAYGIGTVVNSGARCSSACVLIFAAGTVRYYVAGAKVAVHRLVDAGSGEDTAETLRGTAVLAVWLRDDRGWPQVLVERMLTTPPAALYTLTDAELAEIATPCPELSVVPLAKVGVVP